MDREIANIYILDVVVRIYTRCPAVGCIYIYIDFLTSYSHVREAKVRQVSSVSEINVELSRSVSEMVRHVGSVSEIKGETGT